MSDLKYNVGNLLILREANAYSELYTETIRIVYKAELTTTPHFQTEHIERNVPSIPYGVTVIHFGPDATFGGLMQWIDQDSTNLPNTEVRLSTATLPAELPGSGGVWAQGLTDANSTGEIKTATWATYSDEVTATVDIPWGDLLTASQVIGTDLDFDLASDSGIFTCELDLYWGGNRQSTWTIPATASTSTDYAVGFILPSDVITNAALIVRFNGVENWQNEGFTEAPTISIYENDGSQTPADAPAYAVFQNNLTVLLPTATDTSLSATMLGIEQLFNMIFGMQADSTGSVEVVTIVDGSEHTAASLVTGGYDFNVVDMTQNRRLIFHGNNHSPFVGSPVPATTVWQSMSADNAGTISGSGVLVEGTPQQFTTSGDAGGVWSVSSSHTVIDATTGVAEHTIGASGWGPVAIKYTVGGSEAELAVLSHNTVSAAAAVDSAGIISGPSLVYVDAVETYYTNGTAGGTWTSSNSGVFAIHSVTGVGTATGEGAVTITYAYGSDPLATATFQMTVAAAANAGTISGPNTVAVGSTVALSTTGDAGGVWAGLDWVVTVVAAAGDTTQAIATGVAPGSISIAYTVGGAAAYYPFTVVAAAANAGTINGLNTVTEGNSIQLTNTDGDAGVWTSADDSIAVVNTATGEVTGVSQGVSVIYYTVGSGDNTSTVGHALTVEAEIFPSANAGPNVTIEVTMGTPFTITINPVATPGGDWVSADNSVATISKLSDTTAEALPYSLGQTLITYTVTGGGGDTATATYTTNVIAAVTTANAGTISGPASMGNKEDHLYTTDGDAGGIWSSSDESIAYMAPNGQLGGIWGASGVTTITYTVGDSTASQALTILDAGDITGLDAIAGGTTYSSSESGGWWYSNPESVATIEPDTGYATALQEGSFTVTYDIGNERCSTKQVTVVAAANAGTLHTSPPMASLYEGYTLQLLTTGDTGGVWGSSVPSVATINSSTGLVTAVNLGQTTITYLVISADTSNQETYTLVVQEAPAYAGSSATIEVAMGNPYTITIDGDATPGGSWSSSDDSVATISQLSDTTAVVTPYSVGTALIYYHVAAGPGGAAQYTTNVVAASLPDYVVGYDLPDSRGIFVVRALSREGSTVPLPLQITNDMDPSHTNWQWDTNSTDNTVLVQVPTNTGHGDVMFSELMETIENLSIIDDHSNEVRLISGGEKPRQSVIDNGLDFKIVDMAQNRYLKFNGEGAGSFQVYTDSSAPPALSTGWWDHTFSGTTTHDWVVSWTHPEAAYSHIEMQIVFEGVSSVSPYTSVAIEHGEDEFFTGSNDNFMFSSADGGALIRYRNTSSILDLMEWILNTSPLSPDLVRLKITVPASDPIYVNYDDTSLLESMQATSFAQSALGTGAGGWMTFMARAWQELDSYTVVNATWSTTAPDAVAVAMTFNGPEATFTFTVDANAPAALTHIHYRVVDAEGVTHGHSTSVTMIWPDANGVATSTYGSTLHPTYGPHTLIYYGVDDAHAPVTEEFTANFYNGAQ